MRDAHHSGSYGFTILAQLNVGEADDHDNGELAQCCTAFFGGGAGIDNRRCGDLRPVEGCVLSRKIARSSTIVPRLHCTSHPRHDSDPPAFTLVFPAGGPGRKPASTTLSLGPT
jgi:hypothetical protein